MTLIQKSALALVCVGVIPVVVVAYRLVGVNRAAMTEQILRTHAVAARTAADRVQAFVDERKSLATALSANPDIQTDPRSTIAQRLLSGMLEAREDVIAVSITNPRGEEFLRARRGESSETLDRILAADPGSGNELLSYETEEGLWIRIDVALPEEVGEIRMIVDGSVLERVLHPDEIGEHADFVLADRNRAVVVGSLSDLSSFPEPLIEQAASGRLAGSNRYEDDGDGVLAAHAPVLGTPWFVMSRQPAVVAEELTRRTIDQSAIAVFMALVLAAGICALAFAWIVQPVRNLVRAQRRIAGLRDTQPIANEIAELQASFSAIEERLQDQDAIGTVFLGRYQVMGGLGAGMMGKVYRGWDPKLRRSVALKTVRLSHLADEWGGSFQLARNLRNEAVTVAQFSHPHIVAIYDLEELGDTAFIAMELVDGTDLQSLLDNGKLPVEKAIPVASAVAKALAAAHARGIVHHDVKPGNVLLGKDGGIKVSDFGISELVSAGTEDTDFVFGTPGYLAPEALRGEGYDQRSDLFALGVLMYRCLTGVRPFTGATVKSTILSTMETEPVPAFRMEPSMPQQLSDLVMSLIERRPEDRPESAEVVAAQLDELALELGIQWAPSTEEMDAIQKHRGDVPHVGFVPTEAIDTARSRPHDG